MTGAAGDSRLALRNAADDDALQGLFAEVESAAGSVPNLYRALAHTPTLLRSWIDYAWSLRADPEMDRGLRELAILRLALLSGCDYVWRSHWRAARHAGHPADKLLGLAAWSDTPAFSVREQAALAIADQLAGATGLTDAAWQRASATFGVDQSVELVLTIAWYANVVRVVTALAVPLEEGHERAPEVPIPGSPAN